MKELEIIPTREINTFDLVVMENDEDILYIATIEFYDKLITEYCVALLKHIKDFNY